MFTLSDVKKDIKSAKAQGGQIKKISICGEEFGEGYNVYIDFTCLIGDSMKIENYTLSEEETRSKAIARINRAKESLTKIAENNLEMPKASITNGNDLEIL